jgi:hypothetical protein
LSGIIKPCQLSILGLNHRQFDSFLFEWKVRMKIFPFNLVVCWLSCLKVQKNYYDLTDKIITLLEVAEFKNTKRLQYQLFSVDVATTF